MNVGNKKLHGERMKHEIKKNRMTAELSMGGKKGRMKVITGK